MFKKCAIVSLAMICLLAVAALTYAQELPNYLIVNNIGNFIASKNPSSGNGPGIVVGADHFYVDHTDVTYRIKYFNKQTEVGPKVQITQHVGGDSDRWLLHEVEDAYRSGEVEKLGLLTKGARLRDINGNKIISLRGGSYSWVNNYVAISISYTDLDGNKPEPLEVVQAYLQKFPSTIPATLVLGQVHDVQWIKDEMDRRLWLGDKWFAQIEVG